MRQNSHDMVLTGDELRLCEAVLAATRKEEGARVQIEKEKNVNG